MNGVIGEIFDRFERERPRLEQTVDELKLALTAAPEAHCTASPSTPALPEATLPAPPPAE